jgi:excisionase family DNA binding protein
MTNLSTIPQLLTIDQLAERLGTTVRHERRLVAEKRVPYLKVGKLVRFNPDEIKQWLASRRQGVEIRP